MDQWPKKHWLDFVAPLLSMVALAVSIKSCHTARITAEAALSPKLRIADLNVTGWPPKITGTATPMMNFKLSNVGQTRATEIHVAVEGIAVGVAWVPVAAYVPSLEPGDEPVQNSTVLKFDQPISLSDIQNGNTGLSITIEVTADTESSSQYHSCFEFFTRDGRTFQRVGGCRPDTFEMMKKYGIKHEQQR